MIYSRQLRLNDFQNEGLTGAVVSALFVDDVISAASENEIVVLLQPLNSIEPFMQFTVQCGTDEKLPFLDNCVQRTIHGKLETVVYRKPTHTDKYLSFNSHYPRSHKKSFATTLFHRAENLTSNNDARENERQYVTNVLKEDNCPKSFLCDCSRRPTWTDCKSLDDSRR